MSLHAASLDLVHSNPRWFHPLYPGICYALAHAYVHPALTARHASAISEPNVNQP